MPAFSIQLTADTVTPLLAKAASSWKQAVAAQLEQSGVEMESTATQIVPVRTGFLRSTIYHKVDSANLTLELGATANYALWVEVGTRRMAAQPYIRPAFDAHADQLLQALVLGVIDAFQ